MTILKLQYYIVLLKWPAGICLVNLTTNYKQNKLLAYQYNGCSRTVKVSTTVLMYACYVSTQTLQSHKFFVISISLIVTVISIKLYNGAQG